MTTLSQVKPTQTGKYEAFVESQIARARGRIRALDMASLTLGFLIATLVYAFLGMALAARQAQLPAFVRLAAFASYGLFALAYLGYAAWSLCRRVNPYYAARQVELALPGAKNSLVNWLDLHNQKLPPAIRGAISHRAAKEMAQADLEQVISARRTAWVGGVTGALFLALIILFVHCGPSQFFSLLGRSFNPLNRSAIATRTTLQLLKPAGGDVTVPVGQAVSFAVLVEDRVPDPSQPDALKVLYHYHQGDPYEEQPLERGDSRTRSEWGTMLPAEQVHNGFWYKVTGGDAETPEYRVQVRSTPLLTEFQVTYHFRPYLGWPDQITKDPNLEAMRGTEVTLLARTNRNVKEGRLAIEGPIPSLPCELVPGDAQAMRFKLVLDQNGVYRIWFSSDENESNTEPMPYTIKVKQDQAPHVELTEPGKEIHLPANATLRLKGRASDDFGVTSLTLKMKVNGQEPLQARPYRDKKSFRFPDGSYPQHLEYQDFVDLATVKQTDGQPLQKGMVIEYWLEATDNCDYPGPNVGRSEPPFKVIIDDPDQDQKRRDQQREQAQQEQKQHEGQQDQGLDQQKKDHEKGTSENGKNQDAGSPKEGDPKGQGDDKLQKEMQQLQDAIKKEQQQGSAKEGGSQNEGKPDSSQKPKDGGNQDSKPGDSHQKPDDKPQENPSKGSSQDKDGGQGNSGEKGPQDKPKDPPSGGHADQQAAKPDQDKAKGDTKPDSSKENDQKGEGNPERGNEGKEQPKTQDKGTGKKDPGDSSGGNKEPKGSDQGKGPKDPGDSAGGPKESRSPDKETGPKNPGDSGKEATGQDKVQKPGDQKGSEGASEKKPGTDQGQKPGSPKEGPQGEQGKKNGPGQDSPSGAESTGSPKEGGNKQGKDALNGKEKPASEKEGKGEPGKAGPDDQGKEGSPGHKADRPVEDLAKQLQSDDPKEREEARQKLSDLKENAKDQKVRQEAEDALEKDGKGQEQNSSSQVKDLAKKLHSDDPRVRDEAARQLAELEKNAKDAKERKAASDALNEGKKGEDKPKTGQEENKPGDKTSNEKGQTPKTDKGEKPGPKDNAKETKEGMGQGSKPGQPEDNGAKPSGQKEESPGKGPGEGTGQPKGSEAADHGKAPGAQGGKVGDGPGIGTSGNREHPATGANPSDQGTGSAADPNNRKKAGDLQLEEFKKKKDIAMDKLHWTEQQWQDFLKGVEALQKQKQVEAPGVEALPDPRREGGSLSNTGPERVTGSGQDDKLQYRGPALPPPQFREAQKEWTQKVSGLDGGNLKK